MSEAAAIDSITASVVQGALENIAVEMGYKLMRMSYSSIIRESEDFGAALVDAEGRGLAEIVAVDAPAIWAHPRLYPRHLESPARARGHRAAGRCDHAQRCLRRRQPRAGCRVRSTGVSRRPTGRLRRD